MVANDAGGADRRPFDWVRAELLIAESGEGAASPMAKTMSLRLPEDKAAELSAIARTGRGIGLEDDPRGDRSFDRRAAARQDFQTRLERRMTEDREVLERLAR